MAATHVLPVTALGGIVPDTLPAIPLALIAALAGLVFALLFAKPVIAWLTARGFQDGAGRKASDTLNEMNSAKAKTPTMGGLFILLALVTAAVVVIPFDSPAPWIILAAVVVSACLGAVDDWAKLRGRKGDGLRARTKLAAQVAIATAAVGALYATLPDSAHTLWIPLAGTTLDLGWLFIPLGVLVTVGTGNAVNLSDGLDGLAGGLLVAAFAALALAAYAVGSPDMAAQLGTPHIPAAVDVALLALCAAGTCAGFLWFNVHPASIFMGDTGSLALGAGLGLCAVAIRQELLLAVIGAVFVAEALSVLLQVAFFKATKGKRLFRCAPLHHHFQFGGWKETKVTLRFWMLAGGCALLGLTLFGWPALTANSPARTLPAQATDARDSTHRDRGSNPQVDASGYTVPVYSTNSR